MNNNFLVKFVFNISKPKSNMFIFQMYSRKSYEKHSAPQDQKRKEISNQGKLIKLKRV
jgi:hypothetical protein